MSEPKSDCSLEVEVMRAMRSNNLERVAELVEQGADIFKKINVEDLPDDLKHDIAASGRSIGLPGQLTRPIAIPNISMPSEAQMQPYQDVIDRSARAVLGELAGPRNGLDKL